MTETQAKSSATGASTDAHDPSVEAPATAEKGAPEASTRSSTGPDAPSGPAAAPSGGTGGPTPTPVVKSQTPTPAVVTPGSGPTTTGPAPMSTGPGPAAVKDPAAPGRAEPARPVDGPTVPEAVRASSAVPVIAVPPAGHTPPGDASKAPRVGPVAATAPVAGSLSAPVIARASVAPPTASATTVTGTGLRQTSGATTFVTSVAAPTRPATAAGQPAAVGAVRVDPGRAARPAGGTATRGPRRARLHLKRIDPWSVMKFSFAVSLVLFVVAIVATSVLYLALDAMNVWDSLNTALSEVTGQAGAAGDAFKITAKGVIGTAVLLGAVNMVLFTALMTLGAFVYNVCADLVGGVELTLSEKD
jgi:transmembrane protein DUF3566